MSKLHTLVLVTALMGSTGAKAVPAPRVVAGMCKLESTGETMVPENIDPNQHYGMFASGSFPNGASIVLTMNYHPRIYVEIAGGGRSAYAIYPGPSSGNRTTIDVGAFVTGNEAQSKPQWLSCKLEIEE